MTWLLKTKCGGFYRRPVSLQFPAWNKIPEIRACYVLHARKKSNVPINPVLRIYSKLKKRGMGNEWWKWGLPEVAYCSDAHWMWNEKKKKKTSLVTEQAAIYFHICRKQIVQNVAYVTIHRSFILNGIQKPKTGKRAPPKRGSPH